MRLVFSLVLSSLWALSFQEFTIAQTCPLPVLNRLASHKITSGETLATIGQRYKVTPETIMGFNPQVRSALPVGETIVIPPFNGIRVNVLPGTLIRDVAQRYKVRADVLFELNGCQPAPSVLFVPGIVWSPRYDTRPRDPSSVIKFVSPLSPIGKVLTRFSSISGRDGETYPGVDLAATIAAPVFAVADGTVAFAGSQGDFGNLVVVCGLTAKEGSALAHETFPSGLVGKGDVVATFQWHEARARDQRGETPALFEAHQFIVLRVHHQGGTLHLRGAGFDVQRVHRTQVARSDIRRRRFTL